VVRRRDEASDDLDLAVAQDVEDGRRIERKCRGAAGLRIS
jgi:hypothetical protein